MEGRKEMFYLATHSTHFIYGYIRTLETKKPFGINVESGKSTERDKIIFPIIYNRCNIDIGKLMKDEYFHLQTVMKKAYLPNL